MDAETQQMLKNFNDADTNKDGKLSKTEFATFMAKMKKDGGECASNCVRTADEVFAEMDADKDGSVTSKEIMAFMAKMNHDK